MPIYLYRCEECDWSLEKLLDVEQRDEPLSNPCPSCGHKALLRAVGNSGGFRLSDKGNVSWADGGYSTHMGDIWKAKKGV
jgi:putative FmdB family regulatory protein